MKNKSKIKDPEAEQILHEIQNIGVLLNQTWPSQKENYQILDDYGIQEITKAILPNSPRTLMRKYPLL